MDKRRKALYDRIRRGGDDAAREFGMYMSLPGVLVPPKRQERRSALHADRKNSRDKFCRWHSSLSSEKREQRLFLDALRHGLQQDSSVFKDDGCFKYACNNLGNGSKWKRGTLGEKKMRVTPRQSVE